MKTITLDTKLYPHDDMNPSTKRVSAIQRTLKNQKIIVKIEIIRKWTNLHGRNGKSPTKSDRLCASLFRLSDNYLRA